MPLHVPRVMLSAATLALLASPSVAQRPALTGESHRVAEAVRSDLAVLTALQTAHHNRMKVYSEGLRTLEFLPRSGATFHVSYASTTAWAAEASHPALSPLRCYVVFSIAEPTGPGAEPFCTSGRPGSAVVDAPAPAMPPADGRAR